jgi:peptidoglycan/LPS O-acetylase OafA/YrhL
VRSERYVFLDGLRGWGAVVVLVFHYLVQVFPPSPEAASFLQRIIFFNGTMAVCVFFVVSGFSLSIGYLRGKDRRALAVLAIGRYPRLVIPIFAACGLVHLMMVNGLIYPASQRLEILRPFLRVELTLPHLLRFSLFDVFFDYRLFESYIPPLWTMSVELIGSAAVIALLAVFGRVTWRIWVYAAVMIVLMALDSFYSLFVAGIILAELFIRGIPVAPWSRWLLVAGFIGGTLVPIFSDGTPGSAGLFGIAAWCTAWMFLAPLRRLLELPLSRWLGVISFPLYLIHAPLVYSLCLYLLRQIEGIGVTHAAANLIVVAVSMPLAILAAWLFTPVNEWAIRFSRWLGRIVVERLALVLPLAKAEPLAPSL